MLICLLIIKVTPPIAFEILVTVVIMGLQFVSFISTLQKITVFKKLLPATSLTEENVVVKAAEDGSDEVNQIGLVKDNYYSSGFRETVGLINEYLAKNQNAADFAMMKSIVESNLSVYEEDFVGVITIPLYLGLMGTFLGIIVGLLTIALNGGLFDESSIYAFILGVIIAMLASFMGLMLTVINNALKYKEAKSTNEVRKNQFFNFLRVHLLPYIGNELSDVVNAFKNNISRFNTSFSKNLVLFDQKLSENVGTLSNSVSTIAGHIPPLIENTRSNFAILQQLRSPEYRELAESETQLMVALKATAPKLTLFSEQQQVLSHSIEKMTSALAGIESIMNRIKRFEESLNGLGDRIDAASYLGSDLVQKVNRKMDELDRGFDLLKQHSQNSAGQLEVHFEGERHRIDELSRHVLEELKQALNFNIEQNPLRKLERLDTISHTLEGMSAKLSALDWSNALDKLNTLDTSITHRGSITPERSNTLLNSHIQEKVGTWEVNPFPEEREEENITVTASSPAPKKPSIWNRLFPFFRKKKKRAGKRQ